MPDRVRNSAADVPIEEKVAFLSKPESYGERPSEVVVIETHMSWVFLLDRHAYKLKKPVRRPFLDFTTIEARLADSSEEVRLNRRLAPDAYLGIVALTVDDGGRLALGGEGRVVDWLVRMRRLPSERMLDRAIASGGATPEDARRLGSVLGAFSRRGPAITFAPGEAFERVLRGIRGNSSELRRTGIDERLVASAEEKLVAFAESARDTFEERAREGRIVEGHGDLRPEHVDLGPPVLVIDCLEFDRELRILDPLEELAFLDLESELLGAAGFGKRVIDSYAKTANDPPPAGLVSFYKGCRAALRATLAAWHAREPGSRGVDYWRKKSLRYLELAERFAAEASRERAVPCVASSPETTQRLGREA